VTEIPEHLRKRAEEAKAKAAAKQAEGADAPAEAASSDAAAGEGGATDSRIPAHLLARSKSAKQRKDEGGDEAEASGGAVAAAAGGGAVAAVAAAPAVTGPGGHTQRLLTVVKAGSIQDVKSEPQDKVHVWPHLLLVEFVAALACTAFLFVASIFANATFRELADFNATPNPSKAPWYFLGLQELLTMFHPMVAGVTIPGMGIFLLILAPYVDRNPSNKPEDRKFAISVFTVHMMFWATLTMIGSFFRGPGFNFTLPWIDGLFFEM
jgi:hypothetical protein